jgi:hypothetical protein
MGWLAGSVSAATPRGQEQVRERSAETASASNEGFIVVSEWLWLWCLERQSHYRPRYLSFGFQRGLEVGFVA